MTPPRRILVVGATGSIGRHVVQQALDDHIIATNLTGSIQLIRAALPHLRAQGGGRIIQLSTYGGQVAFAGNSLYHATNAPALLPMLAELRVARRGPGRPRTRPVLLRADRAYSARRHRDHLRRRGIKAVIPEPADQAGHRRRRGSAGGRPASYDRVEYRARNVIERGINLIKQWRALASRYDKHALTYRGGLTLAAVLAWTR